MNNHEQPERRPVGKEGAGAHQEGPNSETGRPQKREKSTPEKDRSEPNDLNKHKRSASEEREIQAESNLDPNNTD